MSADNGGWVSTPGPVHLQPAPNQHTAWPLITISPTPPPAPHLQLLDKANEATDRKLARHLVSLYGNGVGRLGNEVRSAGACLRVWESPLYGKGRFRFELESCTREWPHFCVSCLPLHYLLPPTPGRHHSDGHAARLHRLCARHVLPAAAARGRQRELCWRGLVVVGWLLARRGSACRLCLQVPHENV